MASPSDKEALRVEVLLVLKEDVRRNLCLSRANLHLNARLRSIISGNL